MPRIESSFNFDGFALQVSSSEGGDVVHIVIHTIQVSAAKNICLVEFEPATSGFLGHRSNHPATEAQQPAWNSHPRYSIITSARILHKYSCYESYRPTHNTPHTVTSSALPVLA